MRRWVSQAYFGRSLSQTCGLRTSVYLGLWRMPNYGRAGAETTARTLVVGTCHLLSNPHVMNSLMKELTTATPRFPGKAPLAELDQLPYLTAIIDEVLRISCVVSHRLQRVCLDQTISFHEWSIPPGTPTSMTSTLAHNNAIIFPDPNSSKTGRWLPLEIEGKRRRNHPVPFSKGSRQCLGKSLAYAELYMGFAAMFREFESKMGLVDTVRERDVDVSHDMFTGFPG